MASTKQKEGVNLAIVRAIAELRYTLIATGLILILGLSFYIFLPSIGEFASLETKNSTYERRYSYFAWGAELEYQALSAKLQANSKARLRQDLEILSRRFGRGNFNILSLAGIKSSPQYRRILGFQTLYDYRVKAKAQGAVLEIRVSGQNARAVRALHEYLRYLEKNWSA